MDPDAAHPEDTESDNPEISFEIPEHPDLGSSFETYSDWEFIDDPYHLVFVGDASYAYGMVNQNVARVAAKLDDGTVVPAQIFDGGDQPLPTSDYYLIFLPDGATGRVVAYDENGTILKSTNLEPALERSRPRMCTEKEEEQGRADEGWCFGG